MASLVGFLGDLDLAEDAAQEAFAIAAERWPRDGLGHPALAVEALVALTLRALGGLTTEEIARAFLVSEETMKRRLSRARAKIKATAIPFAVPADSRLPSTRAASTDITPIGGGRRWARAQAAAG